MTHSTTTRPQDYDVLLQFSDIASTDSATQSSWIDLTDADTITPVSANASMGWVDAIESDTGFEPIAAQNTDSAWTDVINSTHDPDMNAAVNSAPSAGETAEDLVW